MKIKPFNSLEMALAKKLTGYDFYLEIVCKGVNSVSGKVCNREFYYRSSNPFPSNVHCTCGCKQAFYKNKKVDVLQWASLAENEIIKLAEGERKK